MNTLDFNGLYAKLTQELTIFKFKSRMFNTYVFEHNGTFLCLDFDVLLSVQTYNKLYDGEGIAYDLKYLSNSSYKLTTQQNIKVKKLIEGMI